MLRLLNIAMEFESLIRFRYSLFCRMTSFPVIILRQLMIKIEAVTFYWRRFSNQFYLSEF